MRLELVMAVFAAAAILLIGYAVSMVLAGTGIHLERRLARGRTVTANDSEVTACQSGFVGGFFTALVLILAVLRLTE